MSQSSPLSSTPFPQRLKVVDVVEVEVVDVDVIVVDVVVDVAVEDVVVEEVIDVVVDVGEYMLMKNSMNGLSSSWNGFAVAEEIRNKITINAAFRMVLTGVH